MEILDFCLTNPLENWPWHDPALLDALRIMFLHRRDPGVLATASPTLLPETPPHAPSPHAPPVTIDILPAPAPSPGRLQPHRRERRKRYDWNMAADMLAGGMGVGEVAAHLGCTRQGVWLALRRSPGLRAMIAERRARQVTETGAMLHGLRHDIAMALAEGALQGRHPRLLVFLARELGLTGSDYLRPAADGHVWHGLATPGSMTPET